LAVPRPPSRRLTTLDAAELCEDPSDFVGFGGAEHVEERALDTCLTLQACDEREGQRSASVPSIVDPRQRDGMVLGEVLHTGRATCADTHDRTQGRGGWLRLDMDPCLTADDAESEAGVVRRGAAGEGHQAGRLGTRVSVRPHFDAAGSEGDAPGRTEDGGSV